MSADSPVKPILMCFICKLSFSSAKSFLDHSLADHSLELSEREQDLFRCESGVSAILQCVGSERVSLMSVLEPVSDHNNDTDLSDEVRISDNVEERAKEDNINNNPFITFMNSMTNNQNLLKSLGEFYQDRYLAHIRIFHLRSRSAPGSGSPLHGHSSRSEFSSSRSALLQHSNQRQSAAGHHHWTLS